METVQISENTLNWENEVQNVAIPQGVNPNLVLAIIDQESAGNPNATGSAGEQGLMQLKPIFVEEATRQFPQIAEFADNFQRPFNNIVIGTAGLRALLDRFTEREALRAYNQGATGKDQPGNVTKADNYANSVIEKKIKIGILRTKGQI